MKVRDLVNELLKCEDMGLPVMFRVQNEDGDEQLMGDNISISVSAGCGEVEYCIIDGVEGGEDPDEEPDEKAAGGTNAA